MSDKTELLDKNNNKIEKGFTENLFFLEHFYKKNKKKLIFSAVLLVVGGSAYLTDNYIKEYKLDLANKAYFNYKNGVEAKENLSIIEELNPKLYSLIQFSEAVKNGEIAELEKFSQDKNQVISDLAEYQLYSLKRDTAKLNEYSFKDKAIFRDLAILSEAYSLIENGEIAEAQKRLSFIDDTSSIKDIAKYLNHFGIISEYYDASTNQHIRNGEVVKENSTPEKTIQKVSTFAPPVAPTKYYDASSNNIIKDNVVQD